MKSDKVIKAVSRLLFHFNQLVIPGFGTLELSYASAAIHPSQHLFQPPFKRLAFNNSLKQNDNVLIQHLASAEKISEEHATGLITDFVFEIESNLQQKGSYLLLNVGKFYIDLEKKLQFIAEHSTNHLLSSYGLGHFVSYPVLRPETVSQVERRIVSVNRKKKLFWFRF